jgi:hypothetical protein
MPIKGIPYAELKQMRMESSLQQLKQIYAKKRSCQVNLLSSPTSVMTDDSAVTALISSPTPGSPEHSLDLDRSGRSDAQASSTKAHHTIKRAKMNIAADHEVDLSKMSFRQVMQHLAEQEKKAEKQKQQKFASLPQNRKRHATSDTPCTNRIPRKKHRSGSFEFNQRIFFLFGRGSESEWELGHVESGVGQRQNKQKGYWHKVRFRGIKDSVLVLNLQPETKGERWTHFENAPIALKRRYA